MDDIERETSGFSEGLAHTYKDGLHAREEAEREPISPHHEPPEGLSPEALARFHQLVREERAVSKQRQRLHDRIEFVNSQGVANDGIAAQLVYLVTREREVSTRRKELHRAIDEIKRNDR